MPLTLEKLINHFEWRLQVLFGNNPLGLAERLSAFMGRSPVTRVLQCIRNRNVVDTAHPYFQIGRRRIHYPSPDDINQPGRLLQGMTQVIAESFVYPRLFKGEVMIKPGDVVFDLGANIGTTTLLFAELVGPTGKVFAFEPVTHQTIAANLAANQVTNVEIIPVAVGDKDGATEIEVSDFILDSSIAKRTYTDGYYNRTLSVPLIALDTFATDRGLDRVDFVKIDIEGAEELALRGFAEGLNRYRPKLSISSYHVDFDNDPQHPKLVVLLKRHGYHVVESHQSHIFAS